jgi:FkbM family methyltransferase
MYELSIRGLGIYNNENMVLSGERWLLRNVISEIGNDLVVFDVGANVGLYTTELLGAVSGVKEVHAFEPHPSTFECLRQNLASCEVVKLHQCALGGRAGVMNLYDYEDSMGEGTSHASLCEGVFKDIYGVKASPIRVDVDTVDSIMEKFGIDRIDFLKIDVEGFELDVLAGAGKAIREGRISCIQFEFTQLNVATRTYFKDYFELLFEQYRIYRLLPHGILEIRGYHPTAYEIFGYQNLFAIRRGGDYGA